VTKRVRISFGSESSARLFMQHFGDLSLSAKARIGKDGTSVIVSPDSDEEMEVIRSLAGDISEMVFAKAASVRLTESLTSCIREDKARNIVLNDGRMVRLSPADARAFIAVHDALEEENQTSMRRLVIEGEDSFKRIIGFCRKKEEQVNGNI
jgi:hypothetical protein